MSRDHRIGSLTINFLVSFAWRLSILRVRRTLSLAGSHDHKLPTTITSRSTVYPFSLSWISNKSGSGPGKETGVPQFGLKSHFTGLTGLVGLGSWFLSPRAISNFVWYREESRVSSFVGNRNQRNCHSHWITWINRI